MKLNIELNVRTLYDKKTKCWIMHNKKYNFSAYGRTKKEAKKMFLFCIHEHMQFKSTCNPKRHKRMKGDGLTTCPLCGTPCTVKGDVTKHYNPIKTCSICRKLIHDGDDECTNLKCETNI